MKPDKDTQGMSHAEVCKRITSLTGGMMSFWKSCHGWAPMVAAKLLDKSQLNWQTSLAESLPRWLKSKSDGDLILAWGNLGALVEGQLMLFLSVWYSDYAADVDAIKDRKGVLQDPDTCTLEPLRQFFVKRIWTVPQNCNPYVQLVQQRRNAIHAFRKRNIGTFTEWRAEIRRHLTFVRDINGRLPYPEDAYRPWE